MFFAQRMKPSQSGGFVHIFLVIRRESSVVDTKPRNERYVVTAWITCGGEEGISVPTIVGNCEKGGEWDDRTVRINNVGRFGTSTSWFITTPRISER